MFAILPTLYLYFHKETLINPLNKFRKIIYSECCVVIYTTTLLSTKFSVHVVKWGTRETTESEAEWQHRCGSISQVGT